MFNLFKAVTRVLRGRNLGIIPGVRVLHRFLYNRLKPRGISLVEIEGGKLYVDSADSGEVPDLMLCGSYDPFETEIIRTIIKPGMTVVDVGAHIGYFTIFMANLVGENGRVFAFEPDPHNFSLLARNVTVNGLSNVVVERVALAATAGERQLYRDRENLGNMSFSERNVTQGRLGGNIVVPATTIDNYFSNRKVDFLKVDVQGAEGLVLAGARKILMRDRPKFVMEFWPYGLKNVGTDPKALLKWLSELGFSFRVIDSNSKCLKSKVAASILSVSHNRPQGRGWANVLCVTEVS